MAPSFSPEFRPWTLAQADVLLDMMSDFYAHFGYPFDAAGKHRVMEDLAAHPHYGEVWLIHLPGEESPVGYFVLGCGFSFEYGGRDAFLDELYLRPGYRGRGLGAATLEFVLARARALGIRCLHLEVERYNDAGQKLYRNYGFDDQDRLLLNKWLG